MRPVPQVIGANLPIVVKPDHLRNDPKVAVFDGPFWFDRAPLYVELTNGDRTFTLPVAEAREVVDAASGRKTFVMRVEVEP